MRLEPNDKITVSSGTDTRSQRDWLNTAETECAIAVEMLKNCCTGRRLWARCWQEDISTKRVQPRLIFRRDRVIFNHRSKRHDWPAKLFSKSPFIWSFPIWKKKVLNVAQVTVTFHGISPSYFLQPGQRKNDGDAFFHPLYRSFFGCHFSRIDGVWTYSDPTGNLYKFCQIPVHCLWNSPPDWHSHRGTSVTFSSFLVKFLFCMCSLVSTKWPNLKH